ncbi:MAG: FAD-dependent oxidoreductase [Persicimonas sp.]
MTNFNDAKTTVNIAGAGLSGSLVACYLAQQGCDVQVFEYRDDFRKAGFAGGRSINLALSTRGLNALAGVGLEEKVREMCIPMHGRMMHSRDGELTFQPYGLEGQFINSVSRAGLNQLMVDEADSYDSVDFHFSTKCRGVDLASGAPELEDLESGEHYQGPEGVTIGADGAFSKVRQRLQKTDRFNYAQEFLSHGYKELELPPADDGAHRLDKNALHIWPRHDFMMIALPNQDGSFTCTLFMAFEGKDSFEQLQTEADVEAFFAREFPDAVPHMPTLLDDFFDNPTSSLVTIRCEPYHWEDRVLIIGDAAHAVVPFYGQGMNAAFEDCFVFDTLFEQYDGEWSQILPKFSELRKPNADAIADLALYNYTEMRSRVADPAFLLRKKLERQLHKMFPETWVPLYSMVTFSNIPYAEARERADKQDRLLDTLLPEKPINTVMDWKEKLG